MSTELLTTILIILLIINFVLWIAFLIFLLIQMRKLFQKVFSLVEEVRDFSSTIMGYSTKAVPVILALAKGIQTVKSINTLKSIWNSDTEKEVEDD